MSKLRVLALVHRHLVPPETIEDGTDITAAPWRTEYDVVSTLTGMGHEVKVLPVHECEHSQLGSTHNATLCRPLCK